MEQEQKSRMLRGALLLICRGFSYHPSSARGSGENLLSLGVHRQGTQGDSRDLRTEQSRFGSSLGQGQAERPLGCGHHSYSSFSTVPRQLGDTR